MAADDVKSVSSLSPRAIKIVTNQNVSRFRPERQPASQYVRDLAYDMSKKGNKIPVQVVRTEKDHEYKWELVTGFNRHAAGMLIVDGFEYIRDNGETVHVHVPEFKLKVILFSGNSSARADANFSENAMRKGMSFMDQAVSVRHCRDVLQLPKGEIAERLNIDATYVSQLEKLLLLPDDIQLLLAESDENYVMKRPSKKDKKDLPPRVSGRMLMKVTELPEDEREVFYDKIRGKKKVTLDDANLRLSELNANTEAPIFHMDDEDDDDDVVDNGSAVETSPESEVSGAAEAVEPVSATSTPAANGNGRPPKETAPKPPNQNQLSNRNLRKFYEALKDNPGEFGPVSIYAEYMHDSRMAGTSNDKLHEQAIYVFVDAVGKEIINQLLEEGLIPKGKVNLKALMKSVKARPRKGRAVTAGKD